MYGNCQGSTAVDAAQSAPTTSTGFHDDEELSEHWITIQRNTFANWVLEQIADRSTELGLGGSLSVNLQRDLCDGRLLCALMEALQKQQRRRVPTSPVVAVARPAYQHQCIDNINRALRAMTDDGIRLVNIGRFTIMIS